MIKMLLICTLFTAVSAYSQCHSHFLSKEVRVKTSSKDDIDGLYYEFAFRVTYALDMDGIQRAVSNFRKDLIENVEELIADINTEESTKEDYRKILNILNETIVQRAGNGFNIVFAKHPRNKRTEIVREYIGIDAFAFPLVHSLIGRYYKKEQQKTAMRNLLVDSIAKGLHNKIKTIFLFLSAPDFDEDNCQLIVEVGMSLGGNRDTLSPSIFNDWMSLKEK